MPKKTVTDCRTCKFCSQAITPGYKMPAKNKYVCTINNAFLETTEVNGYNKIVGAAHPEKYCKQYSPAPPPPAPHKLNGNNKP